MFRWTLTNFSWLIAYFTMLTVIVLGLRSYRESAIADYGSKKASSEWQAWRHDAEQMGKDGPVARRAPKTAEPPPLLLMRDHFATCLGFSLLLSSCLFGWLMICVRGALRPTQIDYGNDD